MGRAGSIAIALALGVGLALAVYLGEGPPDPMRPGSAAPDFALPRLGAPGERVALRDLRGKVVLLNFWATWCKPCEEEMPAMERLYRRLRGEGFELLAVSVDEDEASVREFQERLGLSFPILLDPDHRVADRYQTYRFPETYLIDAEGRIQARYVGPREWDSPAYVERIQRLLGPASVRRGAPPRLALAGGKRLW